MNIHEAHKLKEKMQRWIEYEEQAEDCNKAIDQLCNVTEHNITSIAVRVSSNVNCLHLPPIGMTTKELGEVLIPLYERYGDKLREEMEKL